MALLVGREAAGSLATEAEGSMARLGVGNGSSRGEEEACRVAIAVGHDGVNPGCALAAAAPSPWLG